MTLLTLEAYSPNLVEKLSKKSGRPQNEGVRSLRNGAKGLISLRYAGNFCARDTTERLFRQFQKEISANFAFTEFSEVRPNEVLSGVRCAKKEKGVIVGSITPFAMGHFWRPLLHSCDP